MACCTECEGVARANGDLKEGRLNGEKAPAKRISHCAERKSVRTIAFQPKARPYLANVLLLQGLNVDVACPQKNPWRRVCHHGFDLFQKGRL